MLETEKWKKAKEIFQTALDLPIAERQKFIETESNGDELIKTEVESLLEAFEDAGNFIANPLIAVKDFVENESNKGIIGTQIGSYLIEKEIGRGGMGAVYLASRADAEFTKKVAVKLIKRGLDTDEIINRFRNERQILANLEHPNIARLVDGGATSDGLPFIVMEYVEGSPLTKFCHEQNLDLNRRLQLFLEICAAVQYAHRNLIVHRDLKPSNIFIDENGNPKLLDFGIAKLLSNDFSADKTETKFNIMTPEYASPEQIRGETVTTATDVYSLGVMLYELLTGFRPYVFTNQSLERIMHTVCVSEPIRPSSVAIRKTIANKEFNGTDLSQKLKGDLDNIILMAMRKEPERRYSSVEQFADDIKRYLKGLPVLAREDTFSYRTSKFISRNKPAVAAGIGIFVSLLGGLATTMYQAKNARRQRDKASEINKFLQKMLASADPRSVGKDAKIAEVLQIAADSIKKDFAHEPEIIADLSNTIGLTFLSIGQLESAEVLLSEALKIRKSIGLHNQETAMSINNFGKLRQANGDLKEAEKLYRKSLSILRNVHCDELNVAGVLGNLGYLLMLEAKYDEAKSAHIEELEILRKNVGENHSDYAQTLGKLANIYNVTGDKKTAEPMLRQSLAITQKFYGKDHPDIALAMLHLAISLAQSKPIEAEKLFRKSLELRQKFFGENHTETAWSMYYLGDILLRQTKYKQAAECAKQILKWRGSSIPENHSIVSSSLLLLARCLLASNYPSEAELTLLDCLSLRQATLPENHWLIATTKGYLSDCFFQQNKIREAENLALESYKILSEKLGENHEHTINAGKRLKRFNIFDL
jgi:serine/threonine-protein kinase